MNWNFKLKANYNPSWDQPKVIEQITKSITDWNRFQTILGVTGSGKTFTMANIINNLQRPTLILAHNKTLAAQLAAEFREFFPENAVHYFVSYYDYYQPEAYIKKTDTYIEKEATINEEIDRLRHASTEALLTRNDVIIVSSVSCIYWIWEVEDYRDSVLRIETWKEYVFEALITKLIQMQYKRAWADFKPGTFQILGDVIEIFPSSLETVFTLEFFWDYLDKISRRNYFTGEIYEFKDHIELFPAKHTVTTKEKIDEIIPKIKEELASRLEVFKENWDVVKAERLKTKVEYDIEMMSETWYVNWIENYSMYLSNRSPWETPSTLLNFFPKDFLVFVDESHITIPQIGWMYAWDRARKESLIENGFRLPSAFENRPLRFDEFLDKTGQMVMVSATPSKFENEYSSVIWEQIIRPTWLLDPVIEVKDMKYMADDIMNNLKTIISRNERALITTVTKRSSEELAEFLASNWFKVAYLHSEIETLERIEILKNLRTWKVDIIVWVNLLREWLDLPEVTYIAILDAEKQWFLRSTSSLLQIIGRAARNVNGRVVMYSEKCKISDSMAQAIDITNKRRKLQNDYNIEHWINPTTIVSKIKDLSVWMKKDYVDLKEDNLETKIRRLEIEMKVASENEDFELAAELRDAIFELKWKFRK